MTMISLGRVHTEVVRAAVLGMSQEVWDAGSLLDRRLEAGPMTLLGVPAPHRALLDRARRHGALEGNADEYAAPTKRVVIPMTGMHPDSRRQWKQAGHELVDLTLPSVRRLHAMKALLRAESRRLVLVGFRGDPECEALLGAADRVSVVENADDVASLPFSPRFGLICQTNVAERRFATVVAALRMRHPDSNLQAIDTRSQATIRREASLKAMAGQVDAIVILADSADRSGVSLYETARCLGKPAVIISDATQPIPPHLTDFQKIGMTSGVFTPVHDVEALHATLLAG